VSRTSISMSVVSSRVVTVEECCRRGDEGKRKTRSALGREGAKAAARLGIDGRSKMGKTQLVRAVGQKRRSR
jgi:hypothetical protein